MELTDLITRFRSSREKQTKAIFSSLFIAGNRLQTLFDYDDTDISLKQFMLLTMVQQSGEALTFTQLGKLMGCSRQNVKKLAAVLQQKGFVDIRPNHEDARAAVILPTKKLEGYFDRAAARHTEKLNTLFSGYSDQELDQFFSLFMRLYDGIEKLETAAQDRKESL